MFANALLLILLLIPFPLAAQQSKDMPQVDRKAMYERMIRQQREIEALEAEVRKRALPQVPTPLIGLPK